MVNPEYWLALYKNEVDLMSLANTWLLYIMYISIGSKGEGKTGSKARREKKMSNICGCMSLVEFTFFLLFCSLVTAARGEENPLLGLWSREEMAKVAGYGEEKLSTVLVTGSVVCEDCSRGQAHLRSWPIPGAVVAVNCHGGSKGKSGRAEAITDEYGEFLIDLPSHLHGVPKLHRKCNAKVVRLPKNPRCRPAYVMRQKGLRMSSVGNGIRTYTAGKVTFHLLAAKTSQLRSAAKTHTDEY